MKKKLFLLLCALLTMIGVQNVKAYQTPEADGIYYLYNTGCTSGETGFMSTGNNYGFQVVVDKFGFPLKLISVEDGKYQFQFVHHNGYLSDNGFMYSDGGNTGDDPRARTITVQAQGDGKYKLINTNNNNTEIELWYDHNVVGDGTGNRKDYLWQFFSKAERDAVVAGYTTSVKLAAATSMGMPASVDTEEKFDEYLSTNYIGIDQSTKITNGTFDTNHVTTGWETHNNENRTFNLGWGNVDPQTTPEVYEGAGYINHTTISVDKAGLYKVSVNATYRCGNNDNNNRIGDLGYDGSVAYLQANNNIAKLGDWYSGKINGNGPDNPSEANSVYFAAGKYLTEVYVYVGDAKTIDISLHSHAFTWGGWLMFNNFKLTYYSDEVSEEDATAILNQATNLESEAMLASTKTALTDAKNTFDAARTITNYNALNTAIENANASVAAYAPLGTKLSEAASVKSSVSGNSPSYITTFDTNIGAITSDYNAGNYAESAISTQVAAVETEIIALVKSQTAANSDMTRIVPNAACTGDAGDDNWKIKNDLADGEFFRLDTWAGTASGMSVPMIEYWHASGTNISENEIYQTITGLSNGVYRVTAETAVNNESNVAPNAGSALLFANDATKDITTGGTETSFKGQTGTFSVECVVSDGSLKLGLKTVSPNYNWIAFKDVHLTLVNLTVSKTISAAGWATYCSPYALDLEHATGLTDAYIVTGGAAGVLTKTSVKGGTVPANTGLLLKGDEGTATIPVVASSSTNVNDNKLVGVNAATEIVANAGYVLMGSPSLGFYQNANKFTVGANTAYLPSNFDGSGARDFFRLEDDFTGINAVEAAEAKAEGLKDGKSLENGKIIIVKNGVKYSANGQILK